MNWIDSHAHVYLKEFNDDRAEMLQKAFDSGVSRVLMPNVDHTTIDDMLELEARYSACMAMMGLHPCSVRKGFERELYKVEEWLLKRKFIAVGEIGTDLYWDKTFFDHQCEAFALQLEWAKKLDIPVVIHCRESLRETLDIVAAHQDGTLKGVFHCFTGDAQEAEEIAKLGFYVGIGGVATFKKGGLDNVLPDVSLERILLETDSPYLAPVPHRGKRNEPSYIPLIGQRVAQIKSVHVEEVAAQTTANTEKLFGLTKG